MTEAAPLRVGVRMADRYTPEQMHASLCERIKGLRTELDAEMAARARAEVEADYSEEHAVYLRRRLDRATFRPASSPQARSCDSCSAGVEAN